MKGKYFNNSIYYLLILFLFFVSGNLTAQTLKVSSGKLIEYPNFISKFIGQRMVRVWLPDNYQPQKKYNVLYAHDGQNLWDASGNWTKQEWTLDEELGRLQHEKKIKPTIVVSIDNAGTKRQAEYFPQKPFESLPKQVQDSILSLKWGDQKLFPIKIYADNYLKFIVTELKPFIDSAFSTHKDQKHTFIMGSSMGALISLYAICEYPQVFGGAICMSTHWPGVFSTKNNPIPATFYQYLLNNLPEPKTHKIYFDYGTQTLDADYEPYQKEVDEIMKQKGFGKRNWKTVKFAGAAHIESSWAQRLHIPLCFMLK